MAEAYIRAQSDKIEVYSAGTNPSKRVHPLAIKVMKEDGIDINSHSPKSSDSFINKSFDYVITVCDNAKETCPIFSGDVKHQLHIGFEDPDAVEGSDEFVLSEFRRIRDEIKERFKNFYSNSF
jgi:arsenate reductase